MGWLKNVFVRPETRSSSSYTDLALLAAVQSAEGTSLVGDVRRTGALEAVCRLYQAVIAVAEVQGPPWLQRALTATWRAQAVRSMLRTGEHLDVIEAAPGGLELVPASLWTILGGPRPSSWRYLTTLDGPSGTLTRTYQGDDVLHLRWSTERGRLWQGVGPMQAASSTGQLAGGLETRQGEEASSAVGALIPVVRHDAEEPGDEPGDEATDPLYLLRSDIRGARGRALLVETNQGSGDRGTAPMGDWSVKRLGGNIPEAMVDLRTKVGMSVASACGVPLSLIEALATGISAREGWRRFTLTSVGAAWTIIADEVEAKMGVRPELDLSPAYGSDLTGRASAVQKLVAAGVPVDQARALAGL